jgi:SAM-dependent methyltransferase
VVELLAPQPGESILDIGCGSGHLTREIADAVGPRGRACGVDISAQMLALAAHPSLELILDTDWDTLVWQSSDGARTQRVLDGWRRRLAEARLPRTLAARLGDAGFNVLRREAYVIFDPVGGEHSYSSHQIAHLGASALGVDPEEVAAWAEDLRDLARRGEYFFRLNRYVFLAAKPGAG